MRIYADKKLREINGINEICLGDNICTNLL